MEKIFKHKNTGITGTLKEDGHLHFERGEECVSHETIWKGFIENSCDWEEVVSKDYEILSVITTHSSFKPERILTTEEYFKRCPEAKQIPNDLVNIHSVKYLPTGEIFAIGDMTNQDRVVNFGIDDQ